MGLLLDWFVDLGRKVKMGLGGTWLLVLLCFFSIMTIFLAQNILRVQCLVHLTYESIFF